MKERFGSFPDEGPFIKDVRTKGGSKNRLILQTNQQYYNKMVTIYWTCGGVAKMAIIVNVRSQMDQTRVRNYEDFPFLSFLAENTGKISLTENQGKLQNCI